MILPIVFGLLLGSAPTDRREPIDTPVAHVPKTLAESHPTDAEGLSLQYLRLGQIGDAEKLAYVTRLIQASPNDAALYVCRAYQEETEPALQDLEHALALDPDNAEAHYLRFRHTNDLASLSKAIEINPRFFDALVARSKFLAENQYPHYRNKIADISRAIRLDPYNNVPYSYRCMWYYDIGDKVNASRDMLLAQRKQLWTDSSGTYDWTMEMCRELGHSESNNISEAVGLLGEATDPTLEANGSFGAKKVAKSIVMLNKHIERNPQDGDGFFMRAVARHTQGNMEGSRVDIDKAIELDGRTISSCVFRSLLLLRSHRYEEALSDISFSINAAPDHAGFYFIRAACLSRLGRTKEADRDLLAGCMRSGVSFKEARTAMLAPQPILFEPSYYHSVDEWF